MASSRVFFFLNTSLTFSSMSTFSPSGNFQSKKCNSDARRWLTILFANGTLGQILLPDPKIKIVITKIPLSLFAASFLNLSCLNSIELSQIVGSRWITQVIIMNTLASLGTVKPLTMHDWVGHLSLGWEEGPVDATGASISIF